MRAEGTTLLGVFESFLSKMSCKLIFLSCLWILLQMYKITNNFVIVNSEKIAKEVAPGFKRESGNPKQMQP